VTLSKKHYIAIAKIISDTKTEHGDSTALQHLEQRLREYFADDNPNFDRVKFVTACRPQEGRGRYG
jgi:O6-methylguanine-DNA--protein-cysteine methyltransferase